MTTNKALTHTAHYNVKPEALDNNLMNGLFIFGNSTEKENSRWKVYVVGAENVKY